MTHTKTFLILVHPKYLLAVLVLSLALSGCNKHGSDSASAAPAKVDACSLASKAMIGRFSSELGAGHEIKTPIPNVSTCIWHYQSRQSGLMLTVSPADPAGVAKGLARDMAKVGYRIVSIKGLGDEAAVSIQTPNEKLHTTAGIAILEVRVGKRQFGYSPMRPSISGMDSPAFAKLKQLASETVVKLRSVASR